MDASRKRMRSSTNYKTIYLILLVACGMVAAREVVPLSSKVRMTVDAEENSIYGIFPEVIGFHDAQFIQVSIDHYQARISYQSKGRVKVVNRQFTARQFIALKHRVDKLPPITETMRLDLRENLTYLHAVDILEAIPTGQFVVVGHVNGQRMRGILLPFSDQHLNLQTTVKKISVPYHEVETIAYREQIIARPGLQKWIYGICAAIGVGLAEIWNSQTADRGDQQWHYRSMGVLLGLLAGSELGEAVNILASPKTSFSLIPAAAQ